VLQRLDPSVRYNPFILAHFQFDFIHENDVEQFGGRHVHSTVRFPMTKKYPYIANAVIEGASPNRSGVMSEIWSLSAGKQTSKDEARLLLRAVAYVAPKINAKPNNKEADDGKCNHGLERGHRMLVLAHQPGAKAR
jgi:hypothetical protein